MPQFPEFVRADNLVTALQVPVESDDDQYFMIWGKLPFFLGNSGWEVSEQKGVRFTDTSLCASRPFVAKPGDWIIKLKTGKFLVYPASRFQKHFRAVMGHHEVTG